MQWQEVVAIIIGAFVALIPITFIWFITIGGIYEAIMYRRKAKLIEKAIPNLTCSINDDCPRGFICLEGRCVPQKT